MLQNLNFKHTGDRRYVELYQQLPKKKKIIKKTRIYLINKQR